MSRLSRFIHFYTNDDDEPVLPSNTVSGKIARFRSPKAQPVEALTVGIEPVQSGSGDPSPSNVRAISGWTGAKVYCEAEYDAEADPILQISWQSEAGTVYGGTLDVANGVLTVNHAFTSKKWSEFTLINTGTGTTQKRYYTGNDKLGKRETIICNLASYAANYNTDTVLVSMSSGGNAVYVRLPNDTDADTVVEVCYELITPIEYTLTAQELTLLLGENNVWADTGDVSVTANGITPIVTQQSLGMAPLMMNRVANEEQTEDIEDING